MMKFCICEIKFCPKHANRIFAVSEKLGKKIGVYRVSKILSRGKSKRNAVRRRRTSRRTRNVYCERRRVGSPKVGS